MREEKEAVWQRDMHRERERDRERSRSASPNPVSYAQHPAPSSYQLSASESTYGPMRGSSHGNIGPAPQSYSAHTTQEAVYNPYPAANTSGSASAGSFGVKTVRIYDGPTAAEELSARKYGGRSFESDSDVHGDEDKENRRLMDLAVTERLERERASEEAIKKAKSDRLEMDKMKYGMEKQRRSMEIEKDEWKVMSERREREDAFEEEQALLRKRAAEEQDVIAAAKSAEERNLREREESINRDKERERERERQREREREKDEEDERALELDRERSKEKIEEEKKRSIDIAEEAESRGKFFEEEEKKFIEISESNKNSELDRDLERDMDDVMAKESVLSELKDRKKEGGSRNQESSGEEDAGEDGDGDEMEDSVDESRDTYASKLAVSAPLSVPNAKYVQQSVEFRDSLDSPGMRVRGPFQNMSKVSDQATILKSTSEGPSVEDSVDSSHSTLSGRGQGPETSPLSPDLGQGLGRSGSEQGGEEASASSDAWMNNNKEEGGGGGVDTENAILKFDGLTTRELLCSSYQAQESAQGEAAIEEDDRENEQDRISRERASADQEKKVADDRAIQDARASVILRRKQKMERDAVAASLSSLPVTEPDRVKPPVVSASMPSLTATKFKSYSSSEDSPDEKALNKSKSVLGVRPSTLDLSNAPSFLTYNLFILMFKATFFFNLSLSYT
jgi:hypothetical protein